MTREDTIEMFKSMIKGKSQLNACGIDSKYDFRCGESFFKALEIAIKTLEQEPCEDAVSRQAVEKITWEEPSYSDALNVLTEVRDKVRALPPVTPTRKKGKWILKRTFPTKLYDEYLKEYQCSECYRGIRCTESQLVNYPYCHCGAEMESEE